ncbi:2-succinyl-6-hydroxy-2,4-cyclohexadiene-1-carboxylate synthase [Serratia microhaemolytica]|uniref:2-succinyl-6-hydroxy-2, 4-cyclohexadiene-1-carboxylate synthase n=1 Tax=Serratia microhaemolytica TaxID=2675110 RepID=UPI000FDD9FC9|nr:2-succinyl-6-hydroxy-2,4-cyclohexadiene-1-carboxylate synthase [Serratia microhaemolytica]
MLAAQVWQRAGQPIAAGQPWLVWLHGLLGNSREWQPIAARFADWPSLAVDLPGHGGSVTQRCHGFDDVSQQLLATLRQHRIERYWLIGYSLGGRIAMYHACHGQSAGLLGLVVEGGHPGIAQPQLRQQRCQHDADWAQRFRSQPLSQLLPHWYQQAVFASLTVAQRQQLIASRLKNHGAAVADMLEATSLGRQPWLVPKLRQLTRPLRLICGAQDAKFLALAQQAKLPLCSVAAAGHNVHLSNPAAFTALLETFFDEIGSKHAVPE